MHGNRQEGADLFEPEEAITAKEQDRQETAEGKGMQKFAGIEHAELHTRIFDVEAGDQLRFAFRHIERCAAQLCDRCDQEDHGGKRSKPEKPDILASG